MGEKAMSVETVEQVLKAAEALDREHGLLNPRYAVMLARDLLAAQARVGELERDNAAKGRMMQRIFELGLRRQSAFDERLAELEATIARVRELPAKWRKGTRSPRPGGGEYVGSLSDADCANELEDALGDGGKRGG